MNKYPSQSMPNIGGWIEDFFNQGLGSLKSEMQASKPFRVPVNIQENDEAYVLQVVAPGMNREDFSISVEKNMLTISSKTEKQTEEQNEKWIRREHHVRSFSRSFTLNEKVDAENIKAKYNNGILEITVNKKAPTVQETKTIEIE